MTTTTATTAGHLFDRFANDDRFLGFGYIGERRNFLDADAERVAEADETILEHVRDMGWTADELFAWGNSKDGRWFSDMALGCNDLRGAMRYLRKQTA